MTVFMKPPERMRPLRKERNPVKSAIIGILFGALGVGLYFRSMIDFLIPMAFFIATVTVAWYAASKIGGASGHAVHVVGIGAYTIAGRWGYYRARQSNARLAAPRAS